MQSAPRPLPAVQAAPAGRSLGPALLGRTPSASTPLSCLLAHAASMSRGGVHAYAHIYLTDAFHDDKG